MDANKRESRENDGEGGNIRVHLRPFAVPSRFHAAWSPAARGMVIFVKTPFGCGFAALCKSAVTSSSLLHIEARHFPRNRYGFWSDEN
jgi:hypothetical protein